MVQPTVQPSGQQRPPDVAEEERRGIAHHEAPQESTALDLLEEEDELILRLSAEVDQLRRPLVDDAPAALVRDRADYGNRAKLLVRHFATREAAMTDVVAGIEGLEEVAEQAERLQQGQADRRRKMDEVEKMSRGVQGMYLDAAQDFDGALSELMELVRPQLRWELDEGVPALRERLGAERCRELFHSARYVARHAPTHVGPDGPRWYERAPVVSRLVAVVEHLRDYPRASRDART